MSYVEKPLRSQVRISHPNQLLTPADLRIGQDIARVSYMPGQLRSLRALHAAGRFLTAQLRQLSPREQVAAAREGWRTEADVLLMPLWRGRVERIGEEMVSAWQTHDILGKDGPAEPADWTEQLSPVDEYGRLMKMSETYADMGLAPIPAGQEYAGRWLPYVTVAFPE